MRLTPAPQAGQGRQQRYQLLKGLAAQTPSATWCC